MRKVDLRILFAFIAAAILTLQGCSSSPTGSKDTGYTEHAVRFINETSVDISDLHLEMVGSEETFDVSRIAKGEESYRMTFSLPVLEGEYPISYGDIYGYYTQNGLLIEVFVFNYEYDYCEKVTVTISGEDKKVSCL